MHLYQIGRLIKNIFEIVHDKPMRGSNSPKQQISSTAGSLSGKYFSFYPTAFRQFTAL